MKSCSILFWSIIVPIVTYGCEVWVMSCEEIELVRKFQREIGSPNVPQIIVHRIDEFRQGYTSEKNHVF